MNHLFKEQVWKAQFRATEESWAFEEKLKTVYGLQHKYDTARLLIGTSLAEPSRPDPLPSGTKYAKPIPGEFLFGDDDDLWLSAFIIDGDFRPDSTVENLRELVEAHWARGFQLVKEELEACGGNEIKLVQRLAERLPDGPIAGGSIAPLGKAGEIRLKVGSVSHTYPGGKPVDFVINGPGVAHTLRSWVQSARGRRRRACK